MDREIKNEILMLVPFAVFFDFIIYFVSVPFAGFTVNMALGLLLGTVVLFVNLYLLGTFSQNAVMRYLAGRGEKGAKAHMLSGYFLRYLIIGAAFVISFRFKSCLSVWGVAIPLFYPKLIYFIKGIFPDFLTFNRKGDKNG